MNNKLMTIRLAGRYRTLIATFVVALVAALSCGAAQAHSKHHHGRKGHRTHAYRSDHVVVHHPKSERVRRPVARAIPVRYEVPQRIRYRDVRYHAPYRHGSVYHRGHRHHHVVYGFPVRTEFGVVVRPYAYCGDSLFAAE